MAAGTSSAPAASIRVVGAAAAAVAASIVDPTPANSIAAAVTSSVVANTNDVVGLPFPRLGPTIGQGWKPAKRTATPSACPRLAPKRRHRRVAEEAQPGDVGSG